MIVREQWMEEGDEQMHFVAEGPEAADTGYSLQYFREVPEWLWEVYASTLSLLELVSKEIDACPQLPAFLEFSELEEREHARRREIEREVSERVARDRLLQEQLRVAGILKPLPLDVPDEEPVRIR